MARPHSRPLLALQAVAGTSRRQRGAGGSLPEKHHRPAGSFASTTLAPIEVVPPMRSTAGLGYWDAPPLDVAFSKH